MSSNLESCVTNLLFRPWPGHKCVTAGSLQHSFGEHFIQFLVRLSMRQPLACKPQQHTLQLKLFACCIRCSPSQHKIYYYIVYLPPTYLPAYQRLYRPTISPLLTKYFYTLCSRDGQYMSVSMVHVGGSVSIFCQEQTDGQVLGAPALSERTSVMCCLLKTTPVRTGC